MHASFIRKLVIIVLVVLLSFRVFSTVSSGKVSCYTANSPSAVERELEISSEEKLFQGQEYDVQKVLGDGKFDVTCR